jgi:hypothetical protein
VNFVTFIVVLKAFFFKLLTTFRGSMTQNSDSSNTSFVSSSSNPSFVIEEQSSNNEQACFKNVTEPISNYNNNNQQIFVNRQHNKPMTSVSEDSPFGKKENISPFMNPLLKPYNDNIESNPNPQIESMPESPFIDGKISGVVFRPKMDVIYSKGHKSRTLEEEFEMFENKNKNTNKNKNEYSFETDKLLMMPKGKKFSIKRVDNPRRSWASSKSLEECVSFLYCYLLSRDGPNDFVRNITVGIDYWWITFKIADDNCDRQPEVSIRLYVSEHKEFNSIIEFVREGGDTLVYDQFFHELDSHLTSKNHVLPNNCFIKSNPEIQIGIREEILPIANYSDIEESGVPFDEEEWNKLEEEFKDLDLGLDSEFSPDL